MNIAPHTECYIVGGGPSLKKFNWNLLDGKFVIAINRAYEVLPRAQIVYFTDKDWWEQHKQNLLNHKGKKIKGSLTRSRANHPEVEEYTLSGPTGLDTSERCLKHGHNSTHAAINLAAVHLGFKKIYLLGADMGWGEKNNKTTSHWHTGHKRTDPESVYNKMREALATIVDPLKKMGVEVININNKPTLPFFRTASFEEIFGPKYSIMSDNKQPELLGDKVEKVIEALGGKSVAKQIERITKKPCGCQKRKQALNNMHRRMIRQPIPPKIEPSVTPQPRKITPPNPGIIPRVPRRK
jgi:hypothetical protein